MDQVFPEQVEALRPTLELLLATHAKSACEAPRNAPNVDGYFLSENGGHRQGAVEWHLPLCLALSREQLMEACRGRLEGDWYGWVPRR